MESKVFDNSYFGFTKVTVETAQADKDGKPILKKGKYQPVKGASDTEIIPLSEDVDAYMEKNVLNHNKCYLPETIPLCEEMNIFTNSFFADLKDGIR